MWDCRWVRPLVFDDVLSSIYDVCVSFYLGNGCMNERHRTQTNSGTLGQGQLSSPWYLPNCLNLAPDIRRTLRYYLCFS